MTFPSASAPAIKRTSLIPLTLLLAAWLLLVLTRILGPSDLYDKEQPRTVAYTADMLINHFWIIPHDTFGIPATKPPLFNWISLPFVAAFGFHEWALKIPSILASALTLVFIILAARTIQFPDQSSTRPDPTSLSPCPHVPMSFPLLAALLWLAAPGMTAKLLYLARPDMLLTAFLTAAWLAATLMVRSSASRPLVAAGYWLSILGAIYTKGTPALIPLFYLPLAALLLAPRGQFRKTLQRTCWWWGLPLVLAGAAVYLYCSYRQEPEFFRVVLMGSEVSGHVARPLQWFKTVLNGPFYALARFLPWSILVIVMLVKIPPRKWFSHPLAPAILWTLLFLLCMSFVSTKRPDRYAPLVPQMALIAAYAIYHAFKSPRQTVARLAIAVALIMIAALIVLNFTSSEAAEKHYGRNVAAFANSVQKEVGNDPILFEDGELTPLETLLGRNQLPTMTDDQVRKAQWSVRFCTEGHGALAISEPLAQVDPIDTFKDYVTASGYRLEDIDGSKGVQPRDENGETAYVRLRRDWDWYAATIQGRLALFRLTPEEAVERYRRLHPLEEADDSAKSPSQRWLQHYHTHTMLPVPGKTR